MNCACYRFSLSMQSNQSQVSLPVLLNDTARRLLIKLVDNGKPYYINDGCRAVFYAEKPDGNVLVNDCIIEKNAKIRYDFTAQTASAGGISKCEIRLYGTNGRLITSPKFIMVIDKKVVYDDEVLASYSEFTALDSIIATEQSRVEAEAERERADAERAKELDIRTEAAIASMMSSVPVIDATKEGDTATITVTTPEGTQFVTVEDGKDGYTPVKGVDYFDGENAEGGDWDAAEGETGHILNRTHYKEETPAVVLYDGSSAFATELGSITGIDTTQITEGGTYAVSWNGTAYSCKAILYGSMLLGNASLLGSGDDTGEPFCLEILSDTSAYVYKNTSDAETVTIKVEMPGEVTYHKLDNNYLALDWLPVRKETQLAAEKIVTNDANNGFPDLNYTMVEDGQTLAVYMDGERYEVTVSQIDDESDGRYAAAVGPDSLFYLMMVSTKTIVGLIEGEHVMSVWSLDGYNKLPKEYLPDGVVKTVNGVSPDENGNVEIEVESSQNADGLSDDIKATILALFNNIEYTADMSGTVNRLSQLFSGEVVKFSVTNYLDNITTDNASTEVDEGTSYTAMLTASEDFVISEVTITMDGEDVTASVYADGVVNIVSVSGDIVVTATAKESVSLEPVYSVSELAFDGATAVDTGINLFDADKDWTIITEWSMATGCDNLAVVWSNDLTAGTMDNQSLLLQRQNGWYWRVRLGSTAVADYTANGAPWIYIVTRTSGSSSITVRSIVDGVKNTTELAVGNFSGWFGATDNLTLGYSKLTQHYFTGTINNLEVYERILEDTEINAYLGV